MDDGWAALAVAALVAAGVLFLPGWAALVVYGVRGPLAVTLAPALSVPLLAGTAVVFPFLGLRWTWPEILAALLCEIVVLGGIGLLVRSSSSRRSGMGSMVWSWKVLLPSLLPMGLIAVTLLRVLGRPDAFSQTYDNVFHLNAVRYILDTGSGSSLTVSQLIDPRSLVQFYPTAWHDVAAIVAEVTGASIPVCVNGVNLIVASLIWSLGILALVRGVWPEQPFILLGGAIISAASAAYPLVLFYYGVLYPNLLGFALLPAAVFIFLQAIDFIPKSLGLSRAGLILLLGLMCGGLGLAHPNALMSFVLFTFVFLVTKYITWCVHRWPVWKWTIKTLNVTGVISIFAVWAAVWAAVRPADAAAIWPTNQTASQAIGEVLSNAPMRLPLAVVLSICLGVGAVAVWRTQKFWLLAFWAATALTFIIVSGVRYSAIRDFLGGVFYKDSYRIAALLSIASAPIAALGLALMLYWVHLKRRSLLVGGVLMSTLLTQWPVQQVVPKARESYALTSDSALVSTDEYQLLMSLDEYTTPEDRIIVNPGTGSALAYAFADRRVAGAHVLFVDSDVDAYVREHLKDGQSVELCAAMDESGIDYVLDFGDTQVNNEQRSYPGIENLGSSVAELVATVGRARLLRIIACDGVNNTSVSQANQ